jgi:uncharacterized protein HemX
LNTENTDLETPEPGNDVISGEAERSSEKAAKKPPAKAKPIEDALAAPPPKKKGSFTAFLAFLFSLAALTLSAWMWWQDQSDSGAEQARVFDEIARLESNDSELSLKLNQVRDEVDTLAGGDISSEFEALQQRLQTDLAQLATLEQTIDEQRALSRSLQAATTSMQGRLQAAEAAVAGLSTRELDGGGELDLAEVDYLLRLANERVKLFSDPLAADQALEVADMHLAALDNPMYLGVRQDIASARRALAEVEVPDYLEIANRIDHVQEGIPTLAFVGDEAAAAAVAAGAEDEGWWEKAKSAFSSLVTVRRSTEDENQRISLEDKDYVRQRIWLQLEIAHLALMRRDQQAFRSSLERVRESLADWFVNDDAFRLVDADIETLQGIDIDVEVPDITAPWSTLRLLRNATPVPAVAPVEMPAEQPVEPDVVPGETDDGSTEAEG